MFVPVKRFALVLHNFLYEEKTGLSELNCFADGDEMRKRLAVHPAEVDKWTVLPEDESWKNLTLDQMRALVEKFAARVREEAHKDFNNSAVLLYFSGHGVSGEIGCKLFTEVLCDLQLPAATLTFTVLMETLCR